MNKLKWTGPKEWRPELWDDSPFLSPEENEKIGLILRKSKRKGSHITTADTAWLCSLVKRLATCAPDDYDFPAYMALVNPIAKNAFAMRYKESLLIEHSTTLDKPVIFGTQLLNVTTSCRPIEADFVVRPYIRIKPSSDPEAILRLRQATISMNIDGEGVCRGPIDEHLIGPDGAPFRKNRWKVRVLDCLFPAAFLTATNEAEGVWQGVFCPNGSQIQIDVAFGSGFDREITLTTGVVAARYTTGGLAEERARPRMIT